MNEKHTPGLWKIKDGEDHRVYLIDGPDGAVGEVVYADTRKLSDARLIAASPLLLEALQKLLDATLDIGCSPDSKLAKAVVFGVNAYAVATRGEGNGI